MYLVTENGVVLFDTPWYTFPYQLLLDSIEMRHHKMVILCIATHSHEDRSWGLEYYRSKGIKTFTTLQTDEISQKNASPRSDFFLSKDTIFTMGLHQFRTYYPGQGHTRDNIVVWVEKEGILYGGCLINENVVFMSVQSSLIRIDSFIKQALFLEAG